MLLCLKGMIVIPLNQFILCFKVLLVILLKRILEVEKQCLCIVFLVVFIGIFVFVVVFAKL